MKLVKVEHMRCDEYSCETYMMAPDEMTVEQFEQAVENAQNKMQNFIDNYKKLIEVPYPGYNPDYKKYPDKTVKEIDAEFKIKMDAYNVYKKEKDKGYKTFGEYLQEEGLTPLWKYESEFEVSCHWGHQHGTDIEYDEFEDKDFPGPLKRENIL